MKDARGGEIKLQVDLQAASGVAACPVGAPARSGHEIALGKPLEGGRRLAVHVGEEQPRRDLSARRHARHPMPWPFSSFEGACRAPEHPATMYCRGTFLPSTTSWPIYGLAVRVLAMIPLHCSVNAIAAYPAHLVGHVDLGVDHGRAVGHAEAVKDRLQQA